MTSRSALLLGRSTAKVLLHAACIAAFIISRPASAAPALPKTIAIDALNILSFSIPVAGSKLICYESGGKRYFGSLKGTTAPLFKVQRDSKKFKADLKSKISSFSKQIKALSLQRKSQTGKLRAKSTKRIDKIKKQRYQAQLDRIAALKCENPNDSLAMPQNPAPVQALVLQCPDLVQNGNLDDADRSTFLSMLAAGNADLNGDGQSDYNDLISFWQASSQFEEDPASICPMCADVNRHFYPNECDSPEACGIVSADVSELTTQIGPLVLYPFELKSPQVAFYVVSDGTKSARVQLSPMHPGTDAVATVQVLDPDENIIYWDHYSDPAGAAPETHSGSGIEALLPEAFALPKTGIYQIRVMGNHYVKAALYLKPDTQYGFSLQNGGFTKSIWPDMPATMYAWAPVHRAQSMRLKLLPAASLPLPAVFDVTTNEVLPASDLTVPSDPVLEGHIWKFDFPSPNWAFAATGFPLILSPDAASAAAIKASVERIDSGPMTGGLVSHKFQLELARLLPLMLAHAGDADDLLSVPSPGSIDACINPSSSDDYYKHLDLLGYYSGIVTSTRWGLLKQPGTNLPYQIVDPTSLWAGQIGSPLLGKQVCTIDADCNNGSSCAAGLCSQPFNPEQDRWDLLRTHKYAAFNDDSKIRSLHSGPSIQSQIPMAMAFCATTSTPCNPWGPETENGPLRYPELLYRSVAAATLDMMALGEDITPRGINSDEDTYPGFLAFAVGNQLLPVYHLAAPHLEQVMTDNFCGESIGSRVKKIWGNALRRVVDRSYNEYLTSAANQSSHFVTAFQEFAMGSTGLPFQEFYRQQARSYAKRYFDSASPGGYFQESTGPDSSYTGMTHWHLGTYYGMTKLDPLGADENAYDALETSYRFYNHTTAPERDGRSIGACNFGHRIGTGLHMEQWNGAKGLAEDVPSIATWSNELTSDPSAAHAHLISSANSLEVYAPNAHLYALGTTPSIFKSLDSSLRPLNQILPAEESASFTRNFGDQLIAVKRPGYYTAIYVGKPAAGNEYLIHKEELRDALAFEDHAPELEESINVYLITPFLGGGMSLFWNPSYGNSIMTANWSPLTHHGLVATTSANKRYWESYFSTSFALDTSSNPNRLTISGMVEGSNLHYDRRYTFYDDHVEVYVKLTAYSALSFSKLVENIPLLTCSRADCETPQIKNRKIHGAKITDQNAVEISGTQSRSQFAVFDSDLNGMLVVLDSSRSVTPYKNGLRFLYYGDEEQIGRVEIALPNSFTSGQIHELTYNLWPQ